MMSWFPTDEAAFLFCAEPNIVSWCPTVIAYHIFVLRIIHKSSRRFLFHIGLLLVTLLSHSLLRFRARQAQEEEAKAHQESFKAQDKKFQNQEKRNQVKNKEIRTLKMELASNEVELEADHDLIERLRAEKSELQEKNSALEKELKELKMALDKDVEVEDAPQPPTWRAKMSESCPRNWVTPTRYRVRG